jgi:hypothetical protein
MTKIRHLCQQKQHMIIVFASTRMQAFSYSPCKCVLLCCCVSSLHKCLIISNLQFLLLHVEGTSVPPSVLGSDTIGVQNAVIIFIFPQILHSVWIGSSLMHMRECLNVWFFDHLMAILSCRNYITGACGSIVAEALFYKSQGRGIEIGWFQWILLI